MAQCVPLPIRDRRGESGQYRRKIRAQVCPRPPWSRVITGNRQLPRCVARIEPFLSGPTSSVTDNLNTVVLIQVHGHLWESCPLQWCGFGGSVSDPPSHNLFMTTATSDLATLAWKGWTFPWTRALQTSSSTNGT